MPTHRVPFAGPPSDIGCILLELTGERQRDDQLQDESLKCNDGNHAQQSPREVPSFEEEHDFEESQEHDDSNTVCNSSKDGAEFLAAHAEHGSHAASHTKQACKDTCINCKRSKGHNCDTDKRICRFGVVLDTGLSIDVQVRDQGQGNKDDRTHELPEEHAGEVCSRNIAGKLVGWRAKDLAFEAGDACS